MGEGYEHPMLPMVRRMREEKAMRVEKLIGMGYEAGDALAKAAEEYDPWIDRTVDQIVRDVSTFPAYAPKIRLP